MKVCAAFSMRKMSHTRHNPNRGHISLNICVCVHGREPIGPPSKNGKGSLMLLHNIKDSQQHFLFALAATLHQYTYYIRCSQYRHRVKHQDMYAWAMLCVLIDKVNFRNPIVVPKTSIFVKWHVFNVNKKC